jgi:ABC-type uncharacterized transport system ATPase subunit
MDIVQEFDEFRERFGVGQTRGIDDATFLYKVRQQLAEQTSGDVNHEREEIAGEHLDDIILWLKERGLYDDIDYQDEGPDFPAILTMHENELIAQGNRTPKSVEVLLEALRKLREFKFCDGNADHLPIIDDALNAYSSKSQKPD